MTPPTPPAEEYGQLAKDGLVSSVLGFAAMCARLLLEEDPKSWKVITAKGFAASVVAVLVGWAIKEHIQSFTLYLAIVGLCGFAAPEVSAGAIRFVKGWIDKQIGKPEPKKTNGKRSKRK
jgi:hypothetical protein